ncbi:MAG: LamG domain-containing protein [Planctomycetota bacterium]
MIRRNHGHRLGSARPALTLVETVVSIVLVGVMLVAALNTVGASKLGQRKLYDSRQGHELAQALMAEILEQPYADEWQIENLKSQILVDGTTVSYTLGPESAEGGGTRSTFDDVDDYDGWNETPPRAQDGTVMTELTGWRRSVTVAFVKQDDAGTTRTQDEGAKRITVTVSHDDVPVATLVALCTLGPPPTEACCFPDWSNLDMLPAQCIALGGTPGGPGSNTSNTSCKSALKLVAHWRFDETSGTKAADSVGTHTATLTNGPTWAGGKFGNSVNLDAVNDYITVAHKTDLSLNSTMTLAVWVYPERVPQAGNPMTVLHKGTTLTNRNYSLQLESGGLSFKFRDTSGTLRRFLGAKTWTTLRWYHVAATFDDAANAVRLYVDGALIRTFSTAYVPKVNGNALWMGKSPSSEYYKGRFDDARIYKDVLSAVQITTLYNGGEP